MVNSPCRGGAKEERTLSAWLEDAVSSSLFKGSAEVLPASASTCRMKDIRFSGQVTVLALLGT